MSSNIDNIDIEKILAESKRTRLGLEGGSYQPASYQTTVIENREIKDYNLPVSSSQYNQYSYQPSSYTTTYVQNPEVRKTYEYQPTVTTVVQPEVRTSYHTTLLDQPVIHSETVKRSGHVTGASSQNLRLNIIMLGAEIERLQELGRDVDYRYNQLNMEMLQLRDSVSIKERELNDLRSRGGDNSSDLLRIIEERDREILLLKSNTGNEMPNQDLENGRKRLRTLEFELQDLQKKSGNLQQENNKMIAELGRVKQNRSVTNSQSRSTAWCC